MPILSTPAKPAPTWRDFQVPASDPMLATYRALELLLQDWSYYLILDTRPIVTFCWRIPNPAPGENKRDLESPRFPTEKAAWVHFFDHMRRVAGIDVSRFEGLPQEKWLNAFMQAIADYHAKLRKK